MIFYALSFGDLNTSVIDIQSLGSEGSLRPDLLYLCSEELHALAPEFNGNINLLIHVSSPNHCNWLIVSAHISKEDYQWKGIALSNGIMSQRGTVPLIGPDRSEAKRTPLASCLFSFVFIFPTSDCGTSLSLSPVPTRVCVWAAFSNR